MRLSGPPKHIAVTGSSGFIGRHLVARLLRDGHTVTCLSREPVAIEGVRHKQLANYLDERVLVEAVSGAQVLVHLAARAHVMQETAASPLLEYRRANHDAALAVAEASASAGVSRLVLVSSIGVHGNESGGQALRETDPKIPKELYAVSKWEAEQALTTLATTRQIELTILRPPLVYGPYVRGNFLRLMKLAHSGIPLPLGSVRNSRSLIFVSNLADAIVECAIDPRAAGQTFLVSDGEDVSTPELVRRLANAAGRPARLVPVPRELLTIVARALGKADEVNRLIGSLQVDCSRIRQTLDWVPPYSMAQGLKATADWYCGVANC
jgi:nucleoside-diphosphate-sugar epimerase